MRKAGWWAIALLAFVGIYSSQTRHPVPPVSQHVSADSPLQHDPVSAADDTEAQNDDEPAVATDTPDEDQDQSNDQQQPELSNDRHYTNSDGNIVHAPAYSNTVPAGATAQCGDGTYSFSQHGRGTCSHHGGVATWL
jgi:hypothetical protein